MFLATNSGGNGDDGDCNGGMVDGDFDAGYNGLDKVYGCDSGDDGGYNCDYGVGGNGCQGDNVANISVITSVVLNCFHFPVSWHFLGDDYKDHNPLGALRLVTSLCIMHLLRSQFLPCGQTQWYV